MDKSNQKQFCVAACDTEFAVPPEILDVALRGGASSLMVILALLVLLVRANWQAKSSLLVLSSCSIARIWGAAAPEIHLNP